MNIGISDELKNKGVRVILGTLLCNVNVIIDNEALWNEITIECESVRNCFAIDKIAEIPSIAASRKFYRMLGKDPARYRLSAEALTRRIVKGESLYRVNNVVDIVNLVSIRTGYSIGGYDFDTVKEPVIIDSGRLSDVYEAIGRGILNIESLPVLRDSVSAFGSPTSDSVRTSVTINTKRFLMVVFGFDCNNEAIINTLTLSETLLREYCSSSDFEINLVSL